MGSLKAGGQTYHIVGEPKPDCAAQHNWQNDGPDWVNNGSYRHARIGSASLQ